MNPYKKFDAFKHLDWRRKKIISLLSKGKSMKDVADELKVDRKTIWRTWTMYADDKEKELRAIYKAPLNPRNIKNVFRQIRKKIKEGEMK